MWQVEFPKGWCNIDVSVQESIQLAYESGSPTVVVSVLQSSRLDLWRHYEIDFSRMEQRNVDSGRIRKIRLSPRDANAPENGFFPPEVPPEEGKRNIHTRQPWFNSFCACPEQVPALPPAATAGEGRAAS